MNEDLRRAYLREVNRIGRYLMNTEDACDVAGDARIEAHCVVAARRLLMLTTAIDNLTEPTRPDYDEELIQEDPEDDQEDADQTDKEREIRDYLEQYSTEDIKNTVDLLEGAATYMGLLKEVIAERTE